MVDYGDSELAFAQQPVKGGSAAAGGRIPEAEDGKDDEGEDVDKESQKAGTSTGGKKSRIRTEFPETWLWIDKHTE